MDKTAFQQYFITLHKTHPQILHFGICCISAFCGESATYPLDIVKTRLQVYGELSLSRGRPSFIKVAKSILKNEGILSFWQGLSPALYRHFLYTGARMPIYELIRNNIFQMPPASAPKSIRSSGAEKSNPEVTPAYFWRAAIGGIASGAIAQFICSPTDLLKVRLQTERRNYLVTHLPPPLNGSPCSKTDAPTHPIPRPKTTMRSLVKEAGVTGLWRGGLPNVQRAALVNMGEMTTYDTAKRWLQHKFDLKEGPLLHGLGSLMSGFVSATLGTPADFVKTRMMNQRLLSATGSTLPPLYTGMINCAVKVAQNEGFFTLYRGFFLIWARMAPWSMIFWLTYEKMREFTGVGGF